MDISTLQSNLDFVKSLYLNKEWKDEDCKNEILAAIEECNEKIKKAFGESLHTLDKHKPSIEAVEKVVRKYPSTLSRGDTVDGCLPIHYAAFGEGFEYVPILAKEGVKHKVGGEDARGGLLMINPSHEGLNLNTLEGFVITTSNLNDANEDTKRCNTLKELRRSGLLFKNDIQKYHLLGYSCQNTEKERFEYLVKWDPDALIETRTNHSNEPLVHVMADMETEIEMKKEMLHLFLKAGFKYHPNIGGVLFIEDYDGTIAIDKIYNAIGKKETMEILHDILSPTQDYPILHHVFTKAPQHKDLFTKKFPWAYHLKDHNGRTLHQSILAAGPQVMKEYGLLFASLSDNQIQAKDPITTLHPFAAMAVGEHADLDKCFYLLRRQPSVLEKCSRAENIRKRKKRKV